MRAVSSRESARSFFCLPTRHASLVSVAKPTCASRRKPALTSFSVERSITDLRASAAVNAARAVQHAHPGGAAALQKLRCGPQRRLAVPRLRRL